jgi:eukaryotic-like serine/threonine-protein kinase
MSPEQARAEELDARTDLFSFGAVLYEMATGRMPFPGNNAAVIHDALLNLAPIPVARLNPELPPKLEEIINKALEKDRNLRYQNASDMRTDLQRMKRDIESARFGAATVVAAGTSTEANRVVPKLWKPVLAASLLLAGSAVGGYFYLHRIAKLTDKDSIVLSDFANMTGDPVFDGSLGQGLSVQLEQSPFLSLVSEHRVQETLRLMGQSSDTRLTQEVAHDLCERTGSAAVVAGSISQIGTQYNLILKAVNCSTGESLASTEAHANDKNHVLEALGKAASDIRNKLGESHASMQRFDTPFERATTPSLEALKAYSLGRTNMGKGDFAAAVPCSSVPSVSTRISRGVCLSGDVLFQSWRNSPSYREHSEGRRAT